MSDSLLPCPWCGLSSIQMPRVVKRHDPERDAYLHCVNCSICGACGPMHGYPQAAASSWNYRVTDDKGLDMGSGGDGKHEETSDAQELFAYRYWYTWQTAKKWPAGSVVLVRCKHGNRYFYSLINELKPASLVYSDEEYMLIERHA